MKKKSGNQSPAIFTQRLLANLSKLKDNATVQTGHNLLRALFCEYELTEVANMFHHLDNEEGTNEKARREYVKVYATIVEVYGLSCLDYFQKIIQSLFKKLFFGNEVADTLMVVVKMLKDLDQQVMYQYVEYIFYQLNQSNQYVSVGTCIRAMIRALPKTTVTHYQSYVMEMLFPKLQSTKQKLTLLQAVLSLILCVEQEFSYTSKIYQLLPSLIKNQDYNVRRVSIDIYYSLIVLKGIEIQAKHILKLVEQSKYDKIKVVRDAAINCLTVVKEFKQATGIVEQQQKPVRKLNDVIKGTVHSNNQVSTKPISIQMPNNSAANQVVKVIQNNKTFKKQRESTQKPSKPIRSVSAKINKGTLRNESFFKAAQNNDLILLTRPNEQSDQPVNQLKHQKTQHNENQISNAIDQSKQIQRNLRSPLFTVQPLIQPKQIGQEQAIGFVTFNNKKQSQRPKLQKLREHSISLEIPKVIMSVPSESPEKNVGNSEIMRQLMKLTHRLQQSETLILSKLQNLQNRVTRLEIRFDHVTTVPNTPKSIKQSRKSNKEVLSEYQSSRVKQYLQENESNVVESNLEQKIKSSLRDHKYAQAYGLVLTSQKDELIMWLIKQTGMIADRLDTVHVEFLLFKMKDFIKNKYEIKTCLQWLKDYLEERMPMSRNNISGLVPLLEQLKSQNNQEQNLRVAVRQMLLNRN